MFSTCFESEGSSSGRMLCIQVWYIVFYMHRYKQSSTCKTAYTDACKTHYTITVHTTAFLNYESSGSKYVEDIKKLKIKTLI